MIRNTGVWSVLLAVLLVSSSAVIALPLSGCASRERNVQLAEIAYLAFQGDTSGLSLQIGEGEPFAMEGSRDEVRYEVEPGRLRIRVWRNGEVIVNRDVFVSRGQSFLVVLP